MASLRAAILCLVLTVSVLDLAQSASITKVNSLELPSGEKITKREAPNQPPQIAAVHEDATQNEKKDGKLPQSTSPSKDKEDSGSQEDRIYKIEDLHAELARHRRAASQTAEEAEDMDTAANTVFLPQFRKHFRPANRFRREVNDETFEHFAHEEEGGNGRYVREAQNQADDLDTAANTVFLPQFRKRFRPNYSQF